MTGGDPSQAPEPFRIDVTPDRETIVVAPRGEIDVASAGSLHEQLGQLAGAGFRSIVLDLREVSFMDSTGLHAVLEFDQACRRARVHSALIHGPEPVRRLFELTRMEGIIAFIEPSESDRPGR